MRVESLNQMLDDFYNDPSVISEDELQREADEADEVYKDLDTPEYFKSLPERAEKLDKEFMAWVDKIEKGEL